MLSSSPGTSRPSDGRQTAMLGAWNRDGSRKWAPCDRPGVQESRDRYRSDARSSLPGFSPSRMAPKPCGSVRGVEAERRRRARTRGWSCLEEHLESQSRCRWIGRLGRVRRRDLDSLERTVPGPRGRGGRAPRSPDARRRAASKYPDLKIGDRQGRVALTWYDMRDGNDEVYLFVAGHSELRGEIDGRARRVTTTEGESIGAYVAWNGERVGLAWSDKTPGQHEIYFQSFDGAGQPLSVRRASHAAVTPGRWCPPFDRGARDSPWRGPNTGQLRVRSTKAPAKWPSRSSVARRPEFVVRQIPPPRSIARTSGA